MDFEKSLTTEFYNGSKQNTKLHGANKKLQSDLVLKQEQLDESLSRYAGLAKSLSIFQQERDEIENTKQISFNEKISTFETDITELRTDLQSSKNDLDSSYKENRSLTQKLNDRVLEVESLQKEKQNRLQDYQDIKSNYEESQKQLKKT